MSKKQSAERQEAITRLRETLKPGDTVYTVLRSVSRSGMNRKIDLYKLENSEPRWLSPLAARACGWTFDTKREAISVGGCGMDMGFHLVYNLSRTLFHPFTCIGKGCPSNDHHNAYQSERQGQCIVCGREIGPVCDVDGDGKPFMRANGNHECRVCSLACASGEWRHSDGGYALSHRWM